MVLAPSESSILSSDNGLSFASVSFHSACMFRVAVGPLVLYWKRIWNRLTLLKYSVWPVNLFSLWYFSQLFWARPFFFFFFILTCLHPIFGGRLSVFQEHTVHAFQTFSRRSRAVQIVVFFTLHTRITQACPSCARNEAGVL